MEEDAIVFYPSPSMGHIFAMAELANLIHRRRRRLRLHLLHGTEPNEPPTTAAALSLLQTSTPTITFTHLPHRPTDASPNLSRAAVAFASIRRSAADLAAALRRISDSGLKIRALIIDLFCATAIPVAAELDIPVYHFYTSGAASLAAYLRMPAVELRVGRRVFKDSPELVIEIPGLPPIPAPEMPEPLLDARDPAYEEMVYFCRSLVESKGILVNTFEELEPVAMAAISGGDIMPEGKTPAVYNIGPLIEGSKDGDDRHESLTWLDSQPTRSVVFLCFGSRGLFSAAQTKEIANGLERSRQRFLWVVRNPPNEPSKEIDLDKLLPDGFQERTKGVGMVVKGWAPQVAVLSHGSVGGFVTHRGWNSVLEAVVAGKPMVAWPLYAEQHLNRAVLVADMGMAIPVEQRDRAALVPGEELASRVVELMESERGRAIREKADAMRAKALAARKEDGSSTTALEKVLSEWMDE